MAFYNTKLNKYLASFLLVAILINHLTLATGKEDYDADVTGHQTPVLCYVGTWAKYRTGDGFFNASSFNPKLCTHVIYSFVGLDANTHEIKSLDSPNELNAEEGGKDGFKSFVTLKEIFPQLKVLVAVGGWTEGSEKYSAMASTQESRNKFIQSATEFMRKYKFDGLDVDWEYPTQRGGKHEDRENFSSLLKELRSVFNQHGWLLSVAIGAGQYIIDQAYDIPAVVKNVDFINVMTYDYHGKWENKTGHNAPLYQRNDGHDALTNINYTITYLMKMGAPKDKLVLGLPFYGRTFTLDNTNNNFIGAAAHEPGLQGPVTKEPNYMGYHEICKEISSPLWTKERDNEQMVPYAHNERSWISYDDEASLALKVKFALSHGLKGVMVWSLETDDVYGRCHGIRMFLLKTINRALITEDEKHDLHPSIEESTVPSIDDNVIPDEKPSNTPNSSKGSDSNSIHCSLKIGMILTVWALHVLKQKLDVTG